MKRDIPIGHRIALVTAFVADTACAYAEFAHVLDGWLPWLLPGAVALTLVALSRLAAGTSKKTLLVLVKFESIDAETETTLPRTGRVRGGAAKVRCDDDGQIAGRDASGSKPDAPYELR